MIIEALADIERSIQASCNRSGRGRENVTLIAVSKTKPSSMIEEAASAGIEHFGENKVQEMSEKSQVLCDLPIQWHMIGHLQKNKVKKAVSIATLIHSVDSVSLAYEIDKEAAKINKLQDILLEVNLAGEESKFGLRAEDVLPTIRELAALKNVRIRGLMTVAPYTEEPETNRCYFRQMKQLAVDINAENIDNINMDILSMGMSGDYEIAIEEGATHVRIGSKIFGERNYEL